MKLLSKTTNGQVTYCAHRNIYHLEFGNLLLHLKRDELQELCYYVLSIDYEYYYLKNRHSVNMRKLLLHVGAANIHFALHMNEFIELRTLLKTQQKQTFIKSKELMDLNLLLN